MGRKPREAARVLPLRPSEPNWARGQGRKEKTNAKKGGRGLLRRRQERASKTHCSCASRGVLAFFQKSHSSGQIHRARSPYTHDVIGPPNNPTAKLFLPLPS